MIKTIYFQQLFYLSLLIFQPNASFAWQEDTDTSGVVQVITYNSRGQIVSDGTGFLINNGKSIMTAHHVIVSGQSASITLGRQPKASVSRVIASQYAKDWAVIRVDQPFAAAPFQPTSKKPADLKSGQKMALLRPSEAGNAPALYGTLAKSIELDTFGPVYFVSVNGEPGDSGAPVVLVDKTGKPTDEVVGVYVGRFADYKDLNHVVIPIDSFADMMTSNWRDQGYAYWLANWRSSADGRSHNLLKEMYKAAARRDHRGTWSIFKQNQPLLEASPEALWLAANYWTSKNELDEVANLLEQARQLEPQTYIDEINHPSLVKQLIAIYRKTGEHKKADNVGVEEDIDS